MHLHREAKQIVLSLQ